MSIVEKTTQDMDNKEPVVNMKGHFSSFLHFLGPTRVLGTLEPLVEANSDPGYLVLHPKSSQNGEVGADSLTFQRF